MEKEKILVFIPAYNCEEQLPRVLSQINNAILEYIDEIIIVNNLSTDGTVDAARNYLSNRPELPCRIINNDSNYNLGGSHKVAFSYAIKNNFDYMIVLHGDDQADIRDLYPMLRSHKYRKYDCVLGSRFSKGSRLEGYSKLRILGNHGFNLLFSAAVRKRVYDLGSGLNMYKLSSFRSGFFYKYPDKLYFNAVMLLAGYHRKLNMKYYPISWREDDQISNAKLLNLSVSMLKMLFNYTFRRKEFMNSDMRDEKINEYTYKVIYPNDKNV